MSVKLLILLYFNVLFINLLSYTGPFYCLISTIGEIIMTSTKLFLMFGKKSLDNPVVFKQHVPEFNLNKHMQNTFHHGKTELNILNTLITINSIIM